jgi:hypothetical protein
MQTNLKLAIVQIIQQDLPDKIELMKLAFINADIISSDGTCDIVAAFKAINIGCGKNNAKLKDALRKQGFADDKLRMIGSKKLFSYIVPSDTAMLVISRIIKGKLVWGMGYNDLDCCTIDDNGIENLSYTKWRSMIRRSYSVEWHKVKPTYTNCEVSLEWLTYSNFKKWFESNYIEGYVLDKDILKQGNKLYCETTCVFVPDEINGLLITKKNSQLPKGVKCNKSKTKYTARIRVKGVTSKLGVYSDAEQAAAAYEVAKKANIMKVATTYYDNGLITKQILDALERWKVNY